MSLQVADMLSGRYLEAKAQGPSNRIDEMASYLEKIADCQCRVAFSKVFKHFAPRIRSYGLKQFANEAQAMELVQDTLSIVWQKSHLFNAAKGSSSTWIFTIARNLRFDMLRKRQSRKEDICSDDLWPVLWEQSPVDQVAVDEQVTLEQIGRLFNSLPLKQRVVIEAIYLEGKSQQEVADDMTLPLGTVKSRTRLALKRLKQMLKEND